MLVSSSSTRRRTCRRAASAGTTSPIDLHPASSRSRAQRVALGLLGVEESVVEVEENGPDPRHSGYFAR